MAIRKGEDWGSAGALAADAPRVSDNATLFRLINAPASSASAAVGLLGGDLARTLGSPGLPERLASPEATQLDVDLGEIRLDGGTPSRFAAHAVIRSRGYRGRVIAVMNAAWIGQWNVAPRSHPGDGRVEVVDAQIGLADKIKARRRLAHGNHIPHPNITVRRVSTHTVDLTRPTHVWLDGEPVGTARHIEVAVLPEALQVVV